MLLATYGNGININVVIFIAGGTAEPYFHICWENVAIAVNSHRFGVEIFIRKISSTYISGNDVPVGSVVVFDEEFMACAHTICIERKCGCYPIIACYVYAEGVVE